jgi:hypothetical protein
MAMTANENWPHPVAAARQLLISTVDANPATSAAQWALLARYRRGLSDLVTVHDADPWQPATAAEAAMAAALRRD